MKCSENGLSAELSSEYFGVTKKARCCTVILEGEERWGISVVSFENGFLFLLRFDGSGKETEAANVLYIRRIWPADKVLES